MAACSVIRSLSAYACTASLRSGVMRRDVNTVWWMALARSSLRRCGERTAIVTQGCVTNVTPLGAMSRSRALSRGNKGK